MTPFVPEECSDSRIIEVVTALDRIGHNLDLRFHGDDAAIVSLMDELGIGQGVANKVVIAGEMLREAAHRGLSIPKPNVGPSSFADSYPSSFLQEVVKSVDSLQRPMNQRFEGDDFAIVTLMIELGLKQDIVLKLMVAQVVLRECASRGLRIEKTATAEMTDDYTGLKI